MKINAEERHHYNTQQSDAPATEKLQNVYKYELGLANWIIMHIFA
ncbi:MAG: hypothetical protein RMY34_19385 [Aulosira sp. DedQUE10]|nr:hypothetical protein [Aulosira sp. DedQUE10]